MKLIRVYLERKYLLTFRIVMLLIAMHFVEDLFITISTGVAEVRSSAFIRGEHWGYYAHTFKVSMIVIVFVWLGSFGAKEKAAEEFDNNN